MKNEYHIVSCPFPEFEQNPLPWIYSEKALRAWVDEVFLQGYKHADTPYPTLEEAISHLESHGYRIEIK